MSGGPQSLSREWTLGSRGPALPETRRRDPSCSGIRLGHVAHTCSLSWGPCVQLHTSLSVSRLHVPTSNRTTSPLQGGRKTEQMTGDRVPSPWQLCDWAATNEARSQVQSEARLLSTFPIFSTLTIRGQGLRGSVSVRATSRAGPLQTQQAERTMTGPALVRGRLCGVTPSHPEGSCSVPERPLRASPGSSKRTPVLLSAASSPPFSPGPQTWRRAQIPP